MNYYEILGVNQKATKDEIKDAYKSLVKKYHPDVYNGDKSFAEKKIKDINSAYDILSNETSRKEYDEELNPTPTYEYTPPKYNSSPYTYYNYKNNNYNYNNNYNNYEKDNDFYSYYRPRPTSSNYSQNNNSDFSNRIVNKIDQMSFSNKLKGLLLIFIIYIVILLVSFLQIHSILKNDNPSKSLLNPTDDTLYDNTNTNTNTNINKVKPSDEFDINDYFSDAELYEIYNEYYYNKFDNFLQFKNAFSDYIEKNYSF